MTDRSRVSYSNPPMFNWARGTGPMRLRYSRSPDLPPDGTVTVELERNFHTPDEALEPGSWYWQAWSAGELSEGWSDIERVELLPEAHRFRTPPLPADRLNGAPHPRVVPSAQEPEEQSAEEKAQLVKRAESLYRQGVPDDPPRYAPGNPEWPTWIDWYGKVHGGITSRTGRRLQQIAELYVQTRDPQVAAWAKEMALAAAAWDPEGGSTMSVGDIGAHHLLRGLSWCHDALRNELATGERETLRDIIVVRANQFYHRDNPFRGGEANNHAWLRAFGLAEAGLVLWGEHEQAAEWVEFVRQLYLGRFLCCLGYQGDNNEGISYWGYGLWFVIDYADMMKAVCGLDLFQHPWLNQTARFPMYSAPPGAWAVSFADTGKPNHGVKGPAQQTHVRNLALRTQDPYALWYGGARSEVEGLKPRPPVDLPPSIHYRHIGWAIFHTSLVDGLDSVDFALRSGPYYAGHQHNDQNGFVLHAYGEKLAIDSGYYDWYGSDHFNQYSMQTKAHNTILVDGEGQADRKTGADGRIAAYFDAPAYGYTVGDASDPEVYMERLKRFDRRALFIKPHLVIVHDLLESAGGPARYDWLLHTVAPIETDATGGFSLTSGAALLQGRFLAPRDIKLQVTEGFPVEPVDGYSTRPVPPERYVKEWTLTATPAEKTSAEDFLAALDVVRTEDGGTPAAVEPFQAQNAFGLRVSEAERSHLILSRRRDATGELSGADLFTDGEVASVGVDAQGAVQAAFVAAGRVLRHKGSTLLAADRPMTASLLITPHGTLAHVSPIEDGMVRMASRDEPREVIIDGRPARGTFDRQAQLLSVELEAGEHTIAYGDDPTAAGSGPLPELTVRIGEATSRLEGHAQRRADGRAQHWWGEVEVGRPDRYTISAAPGGAAFHVTCDGRPLATAGAAVWLEKGRHFLTVTTRDALAELQMTGSGVKVGAARMLPKDFVPRGEALIVEGEAATAQGETKGKIVEKVGASGGVAHCNWDALGQWAEWEFEVPATGEYELLVRGASVYEDILRALLLDGEPLSDEVEVVGFTATGGWCRTTDDWRYFLVLGAGGEPARIRLTAGKHRLRMEQLGGSMNVDLLAWQPAEQ